MTTRSSKTLSLVFAGALGVFAAGSALARSEDAKAAVAGEAANRATFHRILDKALNGHDVAVFDDTLTSNMVDHDLPPGTPKGPAGTKGKLSAFLTAFPDIHFVFEDEVYQGDKLAGRGYFTGTHKGSLFGIPATGKAVKVKFMDLWRFENGKLAEYWGQPDMMGLMQQLGVAPAPK
jgi:predicted ester cyclase